MFTCATVSRIFCFRCHCRIKAIVQDSITQTHDFGTISLDPEYNNNEFGAENISRKMDAKASSYDCLTLRQLCKSSCSKRLDLHVHYDRFTPLGLMLCKALGRTTPNTGVAVYSLATVQASACRRHHHSGDVALRQVKGRSTLCCGFTEVIKDDGTLTDKFGWNPDCNGQVYYLVE